MSTQRQPKGIPVGGQYAENQHDEAGASLSATATVDHDTLMEIGETREMPVSQYGIENVSAERDEDTGKETVTVRVTNPDPYNELTYTDDEDRAHLLAAADGVTATATRVEPKHEGAWTGEHYEYEVTLENPYTGESMTTTWHTGTAHKNTPRVGEVLGSLLADAYSVENGGDIADWASEAGYEPNYEPDWDSDYEDDEEIDPHREYRETFEACERIRTELQTFLGRRYGAYLWGETDDIEVKVA